MRALLEIIAALAGIVYLWAQQAFARKSQVDETLERRRKLRERAEYLKYKLQLRKTNDVQKEIKGTLVDIDALRDLDRLRRKGSNPAKK